MSALDLTKFLQTTIKGPSVKEEGITGQTEKLQESLRGYQDNLAQLVRERSAAIEREKAVDKSLVGQIYKGYERDKLQAKALNLGVNLFSGLMREGGESEATDNVKKMQAMELGISQEEKEAFNRDIIGAASEDDLALLDREIKVPFLGGVDSIKAALSGQEQPGMTVRERLAKAQEFRNEGTKNLQETDFSALVDPRAKLNLESELDENFNKRSFRDGAETSIDGYNKLLKGNLWEGIQGIGKGNWDLLTNSLGIATDTLGSLGSNLNAVSQYTAENIPGLAPTIMAGPLGPLAAGVQAENYGNALYLKGINKAPLDDREFVYASEEAREQVSNNAIAAAGIEMVADSLLGGITKIGRIPVSKIAEDVVENSAKTLKESLRTGDIAPIRFGTTVLKGGASEAPSEYLQTGFEGEATFDPASDLEKYKGAAIGFGVGGQIASVGGAIQEIDKAATSFTKGATEYISKDDVYKKAVETGDVSGLINREDSKNFDPVKATSALFDFIKKPGLVEAKKEEAITKASEIVDNLNMEREAILSRMPEAVEAAKQEIAQYEKLLKNPAIQSDPTKVAAINTVLEAARAQAKSPEILKPEEIEGAKKALAKIEKQLTTASQTRDLMLQNKTAQVSQEQVKDLVKTATLQTPEPIENQGTPTEAGNQPTPPTIDQAKTAAKQVINLAMTAPDRISNEDIDALLSAPEGVLTPQEISYLQRAKDSKVTYEADKSAFEVFSNIVEGSSKLDGIPQHRARIMNAIASGSKKQADTAMKLFNSFLKNQEDKVAYVTQVFESRPKGTSVSIARNPQGDWEIVKPFESEEERKKQKGLVLSDRSGKMVYKQLPTGPKVLKVLAAEAQAAYDLKFNPEKQTTPQTPTISTSGTTSTSTPAAISTPADTSGVIQGSLNDQSNTENFSNQANGLQFPITQVGPDANSFTNQNAQSARKISDSFNLTEQIEDLFAKGLTVKEVVGSLKNPITTMFSSFSDRESFILNVRATLGIPSRFSPEDRANFDTWLANRNKNKNSKSTPTVSETPLVNPVVSTPGSTTSAVTPVSPQTPTKGQDSPTPPWEGEDLFERDEKGIPLRLKENSNNPNTKSSNVKTSSNEVISQDALEKYAPWDGFWDTHTLTEDGQVVPKDGVAQNNRTAPTPQASTTSSPKSRVSGEQAKKLSDEELNDQIEALQGKKEVGTETAEDKATFSVLDAEMSAREDAASAAIQAEKDEDSFNTDNVARQETLLTEDDINAEAAMASNFNDEESLIDFLYSQQYVDEGDIEQFSEVDQATENTNTSDPSGTEVTVIQSGKLAATQLDVDTRPFNEKNPLAGVIKQTLGKENGTQRPLVRVKNFLQALRLGQVKAIDFLSDKAKKSFGATQQNVIRQFFRFAQEMSPAIQKMLVLPQVKDLKYQFKNLPSYLINQTEVDGEIVLDFDENVKTAMSYSAYTWLVETMTRGANSDSAIKDMLGLSKDDILDPLIADVLSNKFTQHYLAGMLGRKFIQSLGIKATKEASADLLPRLEASMGMMILELLEQKHLVKRENASQLGIDTDLNLQYVFGVNLKGNGAKLDILAEQSKGFNVLDDLFGAEENKPMPTFEPVEFTNRLAGNTKQVVPDQLMEAVNADNKMEHVINQPLYAVMKDFPEDLQEFIIGVEEINEAETHVDSRKGIEAANDSKRRGLKLFNDFVESMLGEGRKITDVFFLQHDPWQNGRVGIKSAINPQADKFMREMVSHPDWEVTVNTSNGRLMKSFYARVADGLGIESDKDLYTKVVRKQLDLFRKDPDVVTAVKALQSKLKDSEYAFTQKDVKAIKAAVAKGKNNTHSFHSLVSLAQLENAIETTPKGKPVTFKTTIRADRDGIANGPITSMILLGGMELNDLINLMKRGGLYSKADNVSQFNEWKAQDGSNKDLYQYGADKLNSELASNVKVNNYLLDAFWKVGGELVDSSLNVTKAGRDRLKALLNPLFFGSSIMKATLNMGDAYLDAFRKNIEKAYLLSQEGEQGSQLAEQERQDLIASFNMIMNNVDLTKSTEDLKTIPYDTSLKQLMELSLIPYKKGFTEVFKDTFYSSIESTLEKNFGRFLLNRELMVNASQIGFSIYEEVKQVITEEVIQERIKDRSLSRSPGGVLQEDLSVNDKIEIEKRVAKIVPIAHSYYSKESGKVNQGLRLTDTKKATSMDPEYESTIVVMRNGKAVTRIARPQVFQDADSGVKILSASIHSDDSATIHKAKKEAAKEGASTVNVHDSMGGSLERDIKDSQAINKSFFENLITYSPLSESLDMVLRQLQNTYSIYKSNPKLQKNINLAVARGIVKFTAKEANKYKDLRNKNITDDLVNSFFFDQLVNLEEAAKDSNLTKLEALKEQVYVGQYAGEGGSYAITDADRKAIDDEIERINSALSKTEDILKQLKNELKEALPEALREHNQKSNKQADSNESSYTDPVYSLDRASQTQLLDFAERFESNNPDNLALITKAKEFIALNKRKVNETATELGSDVLKAITKILTKAYSKFPTNMWSNIDPAKGTKKSSSYLVSSFEEKPVQTLRELIPTIEKELTTNNTKLNSYYLALLNKLASVTDLDVTVTYVTPFFNKENLLNNYNPANNEVAWTSQTEEGQQGIYIRSKSFANAEVNPTTIIHEIVHQTVMNTVASAMDEKGNIVKDHPAAEFLNELKALQAQVRKKISSRDAKDYAIPLHDSVNGLQEFIAWGMTHAGFKSILENITYAPEEGKQSNAEKGLFNGFKAFIDNILGLLFGKVKDQKVNKAFVVLLNNTTALMEIEAQNKEAIYKAAINQAATATNTQLTSQDVLRGLDDNTNSSGFQNQLSHTLTTLVNNLMGPFGMFEAQIKASIAQDPIDLALDVKANAQMPFTKAASANGVRLGDQEAYVAEQVYAAVKASLEEPSSTVKLNFKELTKLFSEAKSAIKPSDLYEGDFTTATQAEKDAIQKAHTFLFDSSTNQIERLARFVALGLSNEKINQALRKPTQVVQENKSLNLVERLNNWLAKALRFWAEKVTKTFAGQPMDQKLQVLATSFVKTKIAYENRVRNNKASMMDKVNNYLSSEGGILGGIVNKAANSTALNNSRFAIPRAIGATAQVVEQERFTDLVKRAQDFRDSIREDRNGLLMGLATYTVGVGEKINSWIRYNKKLQGDRQNIIENTARNLLEAYSTELNEIQKRAITFSFVKTGAYTLANKLGIKTLESILDSDEKLDAEIKNQEKKISKINPRNAIFLLNQAEALGHHLINGGNYLQGGLLRNTYNMSRLFLTPEQDKLSEANRQQLQDELDVLVSLRALRFVDIGLRTKAKEILKTENARTDGGNGVELTIKMHEHLLKDSRERLFKGDSTSTTQYYIPKIVNPRTDLKVASGDEARQLIEWGYEDLGPLAKDSTDPNTEEVRLYKQKDGGLADRVTSSLSLIDKAASGSTLGESGMFFTTLDSYNMHRAKSGAIQSMNAKRIHPPKKLSNNAMVPIFNNKGEIKNYAYHMTTETLDATLEADYRFEHLLGSLQGQTFEKENTTEHNTKVIKFLKDLYDEEYSSRPNSFRTISSKANNKEYRELYNLLPQDTQKVVKEIWGEDSMMVPNEIMDSIFGYRNYSVLSSFRKEASERNIAETALVTSSEWALRMYGHFRGMDSDEAKAFSKRAGIYARKGELAIQEVIRMLKDTIVIKSIVVAADNIVSNQTVLWIEGVPLKEGMQNQILAFNAALQYQDNMRELSNLKSYKASGVFQGKDAADIDTRISDLEDLLKRNPVAKLIDEGMLPSIVDDVAVLENPYSYQSLVEEKANEYLNKLPSFINNEGTQWLGKQVLMTHDSAIYRVLNQLTQMGDFTAKYALYEHLTKRANKPVSHEDAIQRITETFINYDNPLPRSLAWAESIGLVYFFKYFLSIQRVLMRMMKERPASALMMHLAGSFVDGLATVTDSSMLHRIGWNPLRSSVFESPGILTEQAITGTVIKALN